MRCLEPGGWVQLVEPHVYTSRCSDDNTKLCKWGMMRRLLLTQQLLLTLINLFSVAEILDTQGFRALIYEDLPKLLGDTGFINVEERIFPIPFGRWGGVSYRNSRLFMAYSTPTYLFPFSFKTIGGLLKDDVDGWASHFKDAVVTGMNIPEVEFNRTVRNTLRDCEKHKSYSNFHVFIAQKPREMGS